MADDAAALLDALGVDRAHVYGISMGSGVAQEVALRHQEKVRSLILGGATLGGPHAIPAEWALAATVAAGTRGATASGFPESLLSPGYLAEHRSEVIGTYYRFVAYPQTPWEVTIAQMGASVFHDTYDRLPSVAAPTLIVHGIDDPVEPVENAGILAQRIPGAELIVLDSACHDYRVEKAAEANAAVLDFLRRHS